MEVPGGNVVEQSPFDRTRLPKQVDESLNDVIVLAKTFHFLPSHNSLPQKWKVVLTPYSFFVA